MFVYSDVIVLDMVRCLVFHMTQSSYIAGLLGTIRSRSLDAQEPDNPRPMIHLLSELATTVLNKKMQSTFLEHSLF